MTSDLDLNYIDLFAGCGGLSLGLHNAGWKGIFAIEKNPMAFETLRHNLIEKKNHFIWPFWLPICAHDINQVLIDYKDELIQLYGSIDLVAGGPPCQGFSFAGRRREHDERNKLVDSYIKFIQLVQPKFLFFENVRGFTVPFIKRQTRGKVFSDYVIEQLELIGYDVRAEIVDFSLYGVPQSRKRFILIGTKEGDAETFFEKLERKRISHLRQKGLSQLVSASEALSDLERRHGEQESHEWNTFQEGLYGNAETNYQKFMRKSSPNYIPDSHRFANHKTDTITRFEYLLKSCTRNKNVDRQIKEQLNLKKKCIIPLSPFEPSPTLTTLPDDYIHYSEPRILTVREFARLQSFNDWFEFREKYTTGGKKRVYEVPRYSQVGNAIPPLFVEQVGEVMKSLI